VKKVAENVVPRGGINAAGAHVSGNNVLYDKYESIVLIGNEFYLYEFVDSSNAKSIWLKLDDQHLQFACNGYIENETITDRYEIKRMGIQVRLEGVRVKSQDNFYVSGEYLNTTVWVMGVFSGKEYRISVNEIRGRGNLISDTIKLIPKEVLDNAGYLVINGENQEI
jgi:hypothetical protein